MPDTRADATSNELSLEELRREPKVYLLPECENEARVYLCDHPLFQEEM